ncbi:hypothetical protein IJ425_02040 [bacterium]|nr:hypothetical protein [bacterium]
MGLSASQARFLQLTARKSNVEYQAQQINFQRLQWSDKLAAASSKYQDETSNRQMVFSYNTGSEVKDVVLSYTNYKSYMNQQLEGLSTTQDKYYLVSSSGNLVVVSSEEERDKMIEEHTTKTAVSDIDKAKEEVAAYEEYLKNKENGDLPEGEDVEVPTVSDYTRELASIDLTKATIISETDSEGNEVEYVVECPFEKDDFLIAKDLDNVDNFQKAIQEGVYYFAKFKENSETGEQELRTEGWDVLGGGAISEQYDKTDDAAAEAEYKAMQDKVQSIDKKLELKLDQLESERSAIETEIESVSKVIEKNIETSFSAFS